MLSNRYFLTTTLFVICTVISHSPVKVFAHDVEALIGGQTVLFDKPAQDYNDFGLSAHVKYNWHSANGGFFAMTFMNGIHLLAWDYLAGYSLKTKGEVSLEGGGFGAYSSVYGPGFGALVSSRFELDDDLYLSIPLIYRYPHYLGVVPMIGVRF